MSSSRRSFLIGAGSGLSLLALAACTPEPPTPKPTPTRTPALDIPRPLEMLRSNWLDDPFSRGSHSFLAVGATPELRDDLRTPVLDRLFFAGEATAAEHPGTVLGAQLSGLRASRDVQGVSKAGERIAVIGAGIAGVEAAESLKSLGYNVVLVEARDRIGGRIDTRTSNSWPLPVELGAWRLNSVADAALLSQLAALEVDTSPYTGALLSSPAASSEKPDTVGAAAVATAIAWAAGQADMSLTGALQASGAIAAASGAGFDGLTGGQLLEQYLANLATLTGAETDDLSAHAQLPAEPDRVITGGLASLVNDSAGTMKASLSSTVAGISYTANSVSLRLGTGESLKVDRAIITVPLGVLKKKSITFSPALPAPHRAAISKLGMGTTETVWLRFDTPWWSTDAAAWWILGTDDLITTWFNLQAITGDPVLVGIVGGDAAREVSKLGDSDLLSSVSASLAPFATV